MRYLKKNNFKWEYLEDAELTGAYDMPELMSVHDVDIHDAVPFNLLRSEKHPENKWGHCYTYDYQFERLWNNAWKYLDLLKRFKGMIGPDFSILLNMPAAQQIWNCWRNKVLTWFFQSNGVLTIPNVGYSDETSYGWAFDGIPERSVLAVTSQGCMGHDYIAKRAFLNGLHELTRQKQPERLIVYGEFPEAWKERFPMPITVVPSYARANLRREA